MGVCCVARRCLRRVRVMMQLVPLRKGEPARVIKQEPPVQAPARSAPPPDEGPPQS